MEEVAETVEMGEAPMCLTARAAIPAANRQVLGTPEEEEEVGVAGHIDVMDKFASRTSVLAVSWRPFATRWFLISISSSLSEKMMRVWATTFALCRRANETSVPMRSGFPDTRSVSSVANRQNRACSFHLSCSTGSFINSRGKGKKTFYFSL